MPEKFGTIKKEDYKIGDPVLVKGYSLHHLALKQRNYRTPELGRNKCSLVYYISKIYPNLTFDVKTAGKLSTGGIVGTTSGIPSDQLKRATKSEQIESLQGSILSISNHHQYDDAWKEKIEELEDLIKKLSI